MADLRELILMALEDDADFVAIVLDLMADLDLEGRYGAKSIVCCRDFRIMCDLFQIEGRDELKLCE